MNRTQTSKFRRLNKFRLSLLPGFHEIALWKTPIWNLQLLKLRQLSQKVAIPGLMTCRP